MKTKSSISLYVAFAAALLAMAGSLFFSEVLHFTPCVLCWYQRICMYPLVVLLAVGIIRRDRGMYAYVLPLSVIGGLISVYHNLLYWKIIPESLAPCTAGVSCTTKFFELFGFVTIPFMALCAFVIITVCMLVFKHNVRSSYELRS